MNAQGTCTAAGAWPAQLAHLRPWLLANRATARSIVVLVTSLLQTPVRLECGARELRSLPTSQCPSRRQIGRWVIGGAVDASWRCHVIVAGPLTQAECRACAASGWLTIGPHGSWLPAPRLQALLALVVPLGHEFAWRFLVADDPRRARPFVIGRGGQMRIGAGIHIGGAGAGAP